MSNRLRELRKQQGFTLSDVSNGTGLPISTIASYEQGYRNPKYSSLEALADFYNVSLAYLINDNDNKELNKLDSERHFDNHKKEILKIFKLASDKAHNIDELKEMLGREISALETDLITDLNNILTLD